jgi:hypothetical protein
VASKQCVTVSQCQQALPGLGALVFERETIQCRSPGKSSDGKGARSPEQPKLVSRPALKPLPTWSDPAPTDCFTNPCKEGTRRVLRTKLGSTLMHPRQLLNTPKPGPRGGKRSPGPLSARSKQSRAVGPLCNSAILESSGAWTGRDTPGTREWDRRVLTLRAQGCCRP